MGQSFNLGQVANKVNSNGKYDVTQMNGTFGIAQGGTNNTGLTATAGGILYTDGSAIRCTSAGSAGQVLITQGPSSDPTWANTSSTANVFLGSAGMTGNSTVTVMTGSLSAYKFVLVEIRNAQTMMGTSTINIGSATCNWNTTTTGIFNGSVLIDFTGGGCGGQGIGSPAAPFVSPAKGSHFYTNMSTSISVSIMANTFSAGTLSVWGVY